MLHPLSRLASQAQVPHWHQHPRFIVPCLDEVGVKHPDLDIVDLYQNVVLKEVEPIDPVLKDEDFSLSVQLRHGVNLQECPMYLQPGSMEQHVAALAAAADFVDNQSKAAKSRISKSQQAAQQTAQQATQQAAQQSAQPVNQTIV